MKVGYRSDIDGLRAIAVLIVVAFHAFPDQVAGGFVGVDIFFVISGYLISSLIYNGLEDGSFRISDFYVRRIKRIFPALVAVLLACLVVGWVLLLPSEYVSLGKHVAAGAGFVINFSLLQEADYFDTTANFRLLLHLWSLGVEEQFYIVWPALMLLSWRWRKDPLIVSGMIFAGSLVWNVLLTRINPLEAFYLPVTRFWELMVGCILAFMTAQGKSIRFGLLRPELLALFQTRERKAIIEAVAWTGIAMLALAAVVINRQRSFPGFWALLPTMGAGLLIWAGPEASVNRRLLSHRVMVYIGLISYPLYLWHWPILAFARIVRVNEPTDLMRTAAIAAAFLLAHYTYQFVEKPVRFGSTVLLKPIAASVALGLAGVAGLLICAHDGFSIRFPGTSLIEVGDLMSESLAAYRQGTCFLKGASQSTFSSFCEGSDSTNARRIILWGDSHAAHLFPGLKKLIQQDNKFNLAQFTTAGCPPVFGFNSSSMSPHCRSLNELVESKIRTLKPHTVILAARWDLYEGSSDWGRVDQQAVRSTVERLKSMGVERIVAIGEFPVWQGSPSRIRMFAFRTFHWPPFTRFNEGPPPNRDRAYLEPIIFNVNTRIQQMFAGTGAIFISPLTTFCNEQGCLLATPDTASHIVAWDYSHLTQSGSDFFVESNAYALIGAEDPRCVSGCANVTAIPNN